MVGSNHRGGERREQEQPSNRKYDDDVGEDGRGRVAEGRDNEVKRGATRHSRRGGSDSSSGGEGSDSSDSEARRRSRNSGRNGERDKDRERRRGSERQGRREQERSSKRLEDEEEDGGRRKRDDRDTNRSRDSDLGRDMKRSERRKDDQPKKKLDEEDDGEVGDRKGRGTREINGRHSNASENSDEERDRNRSGRQDKEQPRKRMDQEDDVEDDKDHNNEVRHDKRRDERTRRSGRRENVSESSDEERDWKRSGRQEKDQPRKRMDQEEDEEDDKDHNNEVRHDKRRDERTRRSGRRENVSESSDEERDRKRKGRQEKEQPRKRMDQEEDEKDGKNHNNEVRHDKRRVEKTRRSGRQESDSESSGKEMDMKKSEGQEKEQPRKRLDEAEEDKEQNIEGRHGKRRDERSRRNRRRESDSESSGEERRRDRDRERRRRERERRNQYDSSDDERRKRHSSRSDRREDRTGKQRRELEDGEIRSNRDRNEKASELKQEFRNGKEEEAAKAQTQSTAANMNPVGDIGTLGRTGGVYIPPFKLARMMKEIEDKSSVEYQRLTWDALRKSINGLVNKVNATNIKNIIPELLGENLIRGRGLFCRSCMKSQMASPGFTDVFAALVAVVNTKFPEIGDLLLRRIILQLKRSYKRNDKPQLLAAVKFIAHLVNQQVAHELVALELLTILLEQPTDDSVEVAVDFVKECGSILQDLCPKGLHGIFERFRGILHEGEIDKRVQFLIEGLFAIRKAKFQGHPAVRPELDLVEPEDQLTHEMSLDDEIDPETGLDIFKQDPNFMENERRYEELKKSILGDESEDEDGSDAGSEDDEDDEEDDEDDEEEQMQIKDETETNLINLRRTIYLTIMSSVDFEEAGHKLLKIKLEPGQEMELCIMLLECCSQERTYLRYYGLLGQRFCMINRVYQENFDKCFVQQYSMIHRLETNKLRNVAKFFAHLLGTDALPWHVLAYIRLTEEDTTSSSRIFIKILFQELSEHLGIRLLNERLNDSSMQDTFDSIFPKDNPRNTRFAINFFTSIGLGGITENLREYLKNMPRMIMQQQKPESEDESDSGSESSASGSSSSTAQSDSDSGSSSSSSEESSEDDDRRRKRKKADSRGGSRDRKRRKGDK